MNSLHELYVNELQEARSFESQLADSLGQLAGRATDERLRKAFEDHSAQTQEHERHITGILERLGADPAAHQDQSMQRLVEETQKMVGLTDTGSLRDAALISSAQRLEHYEMAVYGTLASFASTLGYEEDSRVLHDILEQEGETDALLSEIAEGIVNPVALEATPNP